MATVDLNTKLPVTAAPSTYKLALKTLLIVYYLESVFANLCGSSTQLTNDIAA